MESGSGDTQKRIKRFRSISWGEIEEMTDCLSKNNLVAESDFFKLFRGVLDNRDAVTVKVWHDSVSFKDNFRRLKAERMFMRHPMTTDCPNVVDVVGYCCDGYRFAAVYLLNSVSTLENLLLQDVDVDEFQWWDRLTTALGLARIFLFLECSGYTASIHLSLPSSVILDKDMNPVLCDIGIFTQKLDDSSSSSESSSSNEAPGQESPFSGLITSSNEDVGANTAGVYSFGMLLLRLIFGGDLLDGVKSAHNHVAQLCHYVKSRPTYKKMKTQRFFYEYDYNVVSKIAVDCFPSQVKPLLRTKDYPMTISRAVQKLENLFLFSLPARKSLGKVEIRGCKLIYFSYENLSELTDNFCEKNLFAQTQLGEAYRGKIQQDWNGMEAQDVIVKIWGRVNCDTFGREVMESSEVDNICRLRDEVYLLTNQWMMEHPNSVKLLGYCFDHMKVGAVYSHKPLDTLQNLLNEDKLSWRDRATIALGLADFLKLLHGRVPQHVVRNICAVHVMVDQDKIPFMYDFSMLKGENDPEKKIANDQALFGFRGYRDPFFMQTFSIVPQSDIYAFGVLLMSLLCKCDMAPEMQRFMFPFVEEEYKAKCSVAHESFESQPLFDQYDAHKLSELAIQCLGLDYPMSRPTASDIVKRLSDLYLLSGNLRLSFNVDGDVEANIWSSNVIKTNSRRVKFAHFIKGLPHRAFSMRKQMEEPKKQRAEPRIERPRVVKTGCLTPELERLHWVDEAMFRKEEKRMQSDAMEVLDSDLAITMWKEIIRSRLC